MGTTQQNCRANERMVLNLVNSIQESLGGLDEATTRKLVGAGDVYRLFAEIQSSVASFQERIYNAALETGIDAPMIASQAAKRVAKKRFHV